MTRHTLRSAAAFAAGAVTVLTGGMAVAQADVTTPTVAVSSPADTTGSTSAPDPATDRPQGGPMGHGHTLASDAEAAKVTAAITTKDASFVVIRVLKDEDGSFDAMGTKDGSPAMYEVSADFATVTAREAGPGRGRGGAGMMAERNLASADETAKVTAAITTADASFVVIRVMKLEDGTFHAMGTKDGAPAMYEVSADYDTVTAHEPGRGMGRGRGDCAQAAGSAATPSSQA